MKIFHRIDDIQEYNETIINILDFFEENTEEFILAVIPDKFDVKFAKKLNEYKHCTIFQHGYEHKNNVADGWNDEFPDTVNYNTKLSLIKTGKEKIENILGHEISGYVPPWNNTGNETIEILVELGFKTYSAQQNNTIPYYNNKDIDIDVVDCYLPSIKYKGLYELYNKVVDLGKRKEIIGIMYHFKDISLADIEKIKAFILKVENLNSKNEV